MQKWEFILSLLALEFRSKCKSLCELNLYCCIGPGYSECLDRWVLSRRIGCDKQRRMEKCNGLFDILFSHANVLEFLHNLLNNILKLADITRPCFYDGDTHRRFSRRLKYSIIHAECGTQSNHSHWDRDWNPARDSLRRQPWNTPLAE